MPKTLHKNINQTILQLAYSIRTRHNLKSTSAGEDAYIPQIYVKNKTWNPPPASVKIENQLTLFEKALKKELTIQSSKLNGTNLSNLTQLQLAALKKLRKNKNIIIKPTDKNLGPAAMDREMYVTQMLNEHLLTKDYIKLTQQEALDKLQQMKLLFKDLISSNKDLLSQPELIYFTRSLKSQHRIPLFYGLPKIYKNPISLCPIVSTTNSLSAIFSIWLDYKTKDLLPLIRSHTKNSIEIVQ
jgi:hypothetical protein